MAFCFVSHYGNRCVSQFPLSNHCLLCVCARAHALSRFTTGSPWQRRLSPSSSWPPALLSKSDGPPTTVSLFVCQSGPGVQINIAVRFTAASDICKNMKPDYYDAYFEILSFLLLLTTTFLFVSYFQNEPI